MASLLDSQTIDIACPHCSHQLRETIGKLKTNPKLTCRRCSGVTEVDATDLRRKVAQAEKSLADLQRRISRLGK